MMRKTFTCLFGLMLLVSAITIGCGDDDPVAPQVGTIIVNAEPNSINAPWLISGPSAFSLDSSGDATLTGLVAGNYTLTWGPMVGWTSPSSATQVLEADGTLSFMGTYVIQTGTITIDPEPNDINAPWQISGPGGFNQSGAGDWTLEDMSTGDYTLTWGDASGYDAPNPVMVVQALTSAATVVFHGIYIDHFPYPETPEELMATFRAAYSGLNIDEYRNALHSDFIFVFADGSPVAPPTGIYTREQDLQSTTRMFNGEQGMDPDGQPRPGVRDIEFTELTQLTVWEDVPETDVYFPGAIRALYDVRVVFYLNTEGMNTFTVDSQQLFYLKSVSEEKDDGSIRTHFYLIGQQDLDGKLSVSPFASNENMSWSIVKVLYR